MSKTILIVEDDRSLSRMWAELLVAEGFNVIAERDGEWALKTFASRGADFVILDVLVPVRNGFQIAERLRRLPGGADVPILMVSGIYRSAHHKREATKRHGIVDYLDKPVRNDDLLAALRRHLGEGYPSKAAAERERARVERRPSERFATKESHQEVDEVEAASASGVFAGPAVGRGDLRTRPFPDLLAELYRWKATGALLLKRARQKKIVYFKDGYPISVKSNVLSECLGKVMVRERMITEEQCDRSLELMRQSRRMQGTVLIEMGLISPHNLVFALELQLRIKLLEIFSWEEGRYQFTSRTDLPAQTVSLDVPPAALILEGLREHWSVERARAALGPVEESYVLPATDPLYRFQDLGLSPDEETLFGKVDGRRTVQDLLDLGLVDRVSFYTLLYALEAAQVVVFSETPARRSEAPPRPPRLPLKPPPLPPSAAKGRDGARGPILPEVAALAAGRAAAPPPADRELKERLHAQLKQMRRQTWFEILGVARTASPSEIRKAYFALAREYHPDRIGGAASDELKELAGEIYDLVIRAWDTLSDETSRKAYLDRLSAGAKKKEVSDQVSRILAAEGKFQRGESYLRRQRFDEAQRAFAEAVELYPDEGEFHAYLGWSLFQTAPTDPDVQGRSIDHVMRAIQLDPKVDKAWLFLGYMYEALGRKDKAEKQFERAIQCNPDCTEALRELRLFSQGRRS